ncbi:SDR family oxidoreductase [Komagataeibacter sp. FXV3]|uniref:SDR family oxidoreductase n=1 Tax=Komagataeibacter sp. FXV3 TaxID=2608998 RepID=UPI00187BAEA8|nr:SDR family oxidoreductase [Komagataeibacter sp. FXV3]MBE7728282.1 SDR family oxidoreductase [Komagataeibacter sp. FXV3]
MSNIIIFGATSAIARACTRDWIAAGHNLFLVGRNADKLEIMRTDLLARSTQGQVVEIATADLNDFSTHEPLYAKAAEVLGMPDTVLVAHGSLPDQKACEASVDLTMCEIRTNALSVISLATLAANLFEPRREGTIAVIGSVAGDRGRQSNYVYGAAKGMVDIFLQGLRNRLAKASITVLTIKPGFVDTPMTAHIPTKGALWATPNDIGQGIIHAVNHKRDVVYLPWFWRIIMLIIRFIPEAIFKRLSL